jgi:hypothetical protein
MKNFTFFFVFISTALIGLSETKTFKWTTAKENDRKVFNIPSGKVAKVSSWTKSSGASGEVKFSIEVDGQFLLFLATGRGDDPTEKIVSGPNRLGVQTGGPGKYSVTLEITDQDSPPSGLTLTDE